MTDLLRLVPGLNTVQSSARDVNVTSRAATGTLSDSLLVLLDGRSIYQDFFGFVAWDFLPIDPMEIKQIEVIRGPASAVWGANAMTGVVNVITKTPREMQGTSVSIRFGQFDRSRPGGAFDGGGLFAISAMHAEAPSDRFAYKVSAGVLTQESFLRPIGTVPGTQIAYPAFDNRGTLQPKLDARADYQLADGRQTIVLAGGISGTEGIIHTGLGPLDVQRGSTFKYGRMTYTRDRLKLQVFVNALDGESPALLQRGLDGRPLEFTFENQAYDVEVSNLHVFGARHLLSYGGNFRHNNFDLSFAPRGTSRDEGGAYVQDTIFLSDHFRWIVGTRVDRFDVLKKAVISPRTTFLMKPRPSQTFRLSFNRAFRAPSFVNSFFETSFLNRPGPRFRGSVPISGGRRRQRAARGRRPHRVRGRVHRGVRADDARSGAVPLSNQEHDSVHANWQLPEQRSASRLAARPGRPGSADRRGTGAPVSIHLPEFRSHQRPRPGAVGRRPPDDRDVRVCELYVAGRSEAEGVRHL